MTCDIVEERGLTLNKVNLDSFLNKIDRFLKGNTIIIKYISWQDKIFPFEYMLFLFVFVIPLFIAIYCFIYVFIKLDEVSIIIDNSFSMLTLPALIVVFWDSILVKRTDLKKGFDKIHPVYTTIINYFFVSGPFLIWLSIVSIILYTIIRFRIFYAFSYSLIFLVTFLFLWLTLMPLIDYFIPTFSEALAYYKRKMVVEEGFERLKKRYNL